MADGCSLWIRVAMGIVPPVLQLPRSHGIDDLIFRKAKFLARIFMA
jgi:hypothetical protein